MATREEIDLTYNWMDEFHRLRLGQFADISCAYYNGISKSLDQAQNDKHDWILDNIGFQAGDRILDVGCGWGPMLNAVRSRGGHAMGLTLSSNQQRACQKADLDARIADWKTVDADSLGKFDGVVSLGAFEHFCSVDEYRLGEQCSIYERYFRFCDSVLKPGKMMYLQTMTWGMRVPDCDAISLEADIDSDECVLARLSKFYPGSWLPRGLEQIIASAEPYFEFVSANSGRLDYIRTLDEWGRASRRTMRNYKSWPKLFKLMLEFVKDKDFKHKLMSVYLGDQQQCFIRSLMDHQRIFFRSRSRS
jgi:cyclopropane-fatty-acyl-phospholipid synthase